ncbi:nucleotidyltransferase [Liquorilactobacillus satsumensis]|uniref:nucleotidyltransferase n=1 Tax=Liquorilactobacillus satsumensis TaxID=259059 RepID=UPI0021C267B2|nr:nucleotidyltransferase [Liquorilactobacillus satsumensis]MCP9311874.1 nucleotidyltransferase [Liquorilactobacillus satsumensis]MCP9359007.1 nucleotidyltransferase [Liquorilactobacillus satsumensis]
MVVVGIIAEYNPFHNGHLYQIRQTRKRFPTATLVVVMSGNFLERGEPAIVDKWTRANEALHCGVDLVVELPVAFCVQPADRFAAGAVLLLREMGVQKLVFGAEHADYDFAALAEKVGTVHGDFSRYNESFAAAYQRVVAEKIGHRVDQPNDMLGLAYAKANREMGNFLELVPLQRMGAAHHATVLAPGKNIASASAIRAQLMEAKTASVNNYVPRQTLSDLAKQQLVSWADFWPLLRYQLLTATHEQLRNFYDVTEGLEFRMKEKLERLPQTADFETWLQAVKSKRYTYTHLARLAVIILLQVTAAEVKHVSEKPYLRLLGFTPAGQQLLNQRKKKVAFPLITRVTQQIRKEQLQVDYRAGLIYELASLRVQDHGRAPLRVGYSLSRESH